MKYFGAVIAALCRAFFEYIQQSYRTASKPLLLIRLLFVLLTIIISTLAIRAIVKNSDDDVKTFGDAFRIVFGAISIILSITTFIVMSDFTFLMSYLQTHVFKHLDSLWTNFVATTSETTNHV